MEMTVRSLGRSGVKVSPICLGAMMFGQRTDEQTSRRMIDRALEAGVNLIDTANIYAQGRSEEILGRALKGRRGAVILATKVNGRTGPGPNDRGNSLRHLLTEVDNSLRRLDTDYIDLCQLHRPDPDTPLEETCLALDILVRQGKVRYAGVSEYAAWEICRMRWIQDREHYAPLVSNQPQYNILRRGIEREVIPVCRELGIGILPFSPLGGGVFTGKYRRGGKAPEDSRYAHNEQISERLRERLAVDAVYDILETLEPRAAALGKTIAQYAIAWTLANPAITATIIGPRTPEQLEDNLGAVGWEFPPEELELIDELTARYNAPVPIKLHPFFP